MPTVEPTQIPGTATTRPVNSSQTFKGINHGTSHHTLNSRIVFAALMLLPVIPVAAQTAALDGKVFVTDIGFKGKDAHEKGEILTFKDGKFHSSNCDQYGYNQGDYKTATQGDGTTFETETQSEKYGRLSWKGTVRGSQIEGTFTMFPKPVFFDRNPAPIEHWFKGQPKV